MSWSMWSPVKLTFDEGGGLFCCCGELVDELEYVVSSKTNI